MEPFRKCALLLLLLAVAGCNAGSDLEKTTRMRQLIEIGQYDAASGEMGHPSQPTAATQRKNPQILSWIIGPDGRRTSPPTNGSGLPDELGQGD